MNLYPQYKEILDISKKASEKNRREIDFTVSLETFSTKSPCTVKFSFKFLDNETYKICLNPKGNLIFVSTKDDHGAYLDGGFQCIWRGDRMENATELFGYWGNFE